MRTHDRYITIRDGICHYHRRVPRIFHAYDPRKVVRATLRTRSMTVARERRDRMEDADDEYWASLVGIDLGEASPAEIKALRATIEKRYKTACIQAVAKGAAETPWHNVLRDLALGRLADHLIDGDSHGGQPEIAQTGRRLSFPLKVAPCDMLIAKFVGKWFDGPETVFGRRYIESAASG